MKKLPLLLAGLASAALPKFVVDELTGQTGTALAGVQSCRLESCGGVRIPVRWPDGKHTFPCSNGMVEVDGKPETWMIPKVCV